MSMAGAEASSQTARKLLGRHVRVRLDAKVIVTGTLPGFGQGGDFEILDDSDGFVHYCWPMLSDPDGLPPASYPQWRRDVTARRARAAV